MKLFHLALLLPNIVTARLRGGRELVADDNWRRAGGTSNKVACGTTEVPPKPHTIGTTITIGFSELCEYSGVSIEKSSEGGQSIGWLHEGDSVNFDIALATAGLYEMQVRIASPSGDGAFEMTNVGTGDKYKEFNKLPKTGGWQEWKTLSAGNVGLPSGSSTIQITSREDGWNLLWIKLTMISAIQQEVQIHAEDFVLPSTVQTYKSSEGTSNLAYIYSGDAYQFQVNLVSSGTYRIHARVSNAKNMGAFSVADAETGRVYGSVDFIPPTQGWDHWATVRVGDVHIPAGEHTLELIILEGGWNLGWVSIGLMDVISYDAAAEKFLIGGRESFTVHAKNFVDSYGVDVDSWNSNVGGLDSYGDYVVYNINVPSAGIYTMNLQVSSPETKGSFNVVDQATGIVLVEAATVPHTGGWHNWSTMSIRGVSLQQGVMPLKIIVERGVWNLMTISFERTA